MAHICPALSAHFTLFPRHCLFPSSSSVLPLTSFLPSTSVSLPFYLCCPLCCWSFFFTPPLVCFLFKLLCPLTICFYSHVHDCLHLPSVLSPFCIHLIYLHSLIFLFTSLLFVWTVGKRVGCNMFFLAGKYITSAHLCSPVCTMLMEQH